MKFVFFVGSSQASVYALAFFYSWPGPAFEVEYIHGIFPELTHQVIVEAIKVAGPGRKEVIRYLEKSSK
jgi:hypothetical protein